MKSIKKLLAERILILDGGLGTMIQSFHLTEDDYRGERFAGFNGQLKGNNDLLNITRPDVISNIHRQYLDAGADIFSTNTFNANAISLEDYGMSSLAREMNIAAGQLSRKLADDYMKEYPDRTIFVAGSIGPTNKTASMSPDVNDPAFRTVSYMDLYNAYHEQVEALVDGGVDILLFETTFDTLNVKAGLDAAVRVMQDKGRELPIMLSLTLSGKGGRSFSGQTLGAFLASVQHVPLMSAGLNCSFGASDMKPYLKELADIAPYFISAYPNAGLPNQFGQYDETPETMAAQIKAFIDEGLVNIVGGCCGTTPSHIAKYPALIRDAEPHKPVEKPVALQLSGLELLEVKPENNFINIGERCNVAGSRKFLRLIKERNYEEALTIARKQVEDGAQVIDINMDDGLLDAVQEMKTFLNLIASEPDIARVPVMIDSSKWEVIRQGLMCVQGKSIVNSISLKEGEEAFIRHAEEIRRLGAAAVVMAFDERGQADVYERKTEVCGRAYRLLTEKAGFPPQDIIFDPNVLAIATGMSEHNGYGLDFIRAVGWIKKNLPLAKVSGGVSNLSFSFRGNNYVREAMHAVFLYHAIREGMDMGIVNPSASVAYDDIEPAFRRLLEDVILARRPEAAEELIAYAQENAERSSGIQTKTQDVWREQSLEERLEYALTKGVGDYMEQDLQEALQKYGTAVRIIDGPLMNGMNKVGNLFGAGKMFLPQVVKTARTMKKAVAILQPAIETEKASTGASKAGKVVFATVKGDVHDIGKNIVSIVLTCNNYEVIDLGVMVPAEMILETVRKEKPDLLCLSGLITPSLEEMVHVTDEMQKAGMRIPIMIGGATTSRLHTALKIAPHYDYPVIHVVDASQNPIIAAKLLNPATRDNYIKELNDDYERLRKIQLASVETKTLFSLEEARRHRLKTDWTACKPVPPGQKGGGVHKMEIPVTEVIPYINWTFFFTAWRLNGRYGDLTRLHECEGCRAAWLNEQPETERAKAKEALKLYDDARKILRRMTGGTTSDAITDELPPDLTSAIEQLPEASGATAQQFPEATMAFVQTGKANTPVCCEAVYGFFPAASNGDNIRIGNETFPMLRQQTMNDNGFCLSLADYVMPEQEDGEDYIGVFAVTVGKYVESLCCKYEKEHDTYNVMLVRTLSDRLAEASSEYLHEKVRREYWGYAPDENLPVDEMFKAHYQGIRPAVGYPSLPDQGLIFKMDNLLHLDKIGISLTENGAMSPLSSVAGFYFSHPESSYFMIGRISEEQLQDYAVRRGEDAGDLRRFLAQNLK
ncbi:MAG: methionine synthase [Tannerella sp.]|jgi:5-methyltetrahydrofolate--homocysteine methyltransferase|nr:methionine synthase [Tannerella sp.]